MSQSVSGPSNVYVNLLSPLCWILPASRELQVLLEKGPGLNFKRYLRNNAIRAENLCKHTNTPTSVQL